MICNVAFTKKIERIKLSTKRDLAILINDEKKTYLRRRGKNKHVNPFKHDFSKMWIIS